MLVAVVKGGGAGVEGQELGGSAGDLYLWGLCERGGWVGKGWSEDGEKRGELNR